MGVCIGDWMMFEQFLQLFSRGNREAKAAPIKKEFAFAKNQAKKTPEVIMNEPAIPAETEVKPPVLLLPEAEEMPAPVAKPAPQPSMPLPSSISAQDVFVPHSLKKSSPERFTYVDKPHKPIQKEDHKRSEEVIKYHLKPLAPPKKIEHNDTRVLAGESQDQP